MPLPDIVKGTYVNILMGDGADPEVFTPICGLNTRGFTEQVNTSDKFIRDCADPEYVPIRRLIASGKQWDITGSGWMNRSQLAMINAAVGVTKNYRFEIGEPADDQVYGGYYGGPAMLTSKAITGADDDDVTIDLTLASDGAWIFTEV
ncbi:MAG: hypothetical protein GC201_00995 [Alphaproteobacteria bacterium]|nr:hypothetical protein [Alphaproteobacteria bacterium]